MTKGFTKNGKFHPVGDSPNPAVSSDQAKDDSENNSVNVSEAQKIKESKS